MSKITMDNNLFQLVEDPVASNINGGIYMKFGSAIYNCTTKKPVRFGNSSRHWLVTFARGNLRVPVFYNYFCK